MARIRRNLANMKFGKLTAVEYMGTDSFRNALWKCECDCGNTIVEKGTLLTTGKVVSCGQCSNKYNFDDPQKTEISSSLIGKRFGRLLVLEEKTEIEKDEETGEEVKREIVKCKCDCGNVVDILKSCLMSGNTKSCGCLQKDKVNGALFNLDVSRIGKKYGLLTVLSYDTDKKMWKCKCDCGNITYVKRFNGNTRSCGCLKQMTKAEKEQALSGNYPKALTKDLEKVVKKNKKLTKSKKDINNNEKDVMNKYLY